MATKGRHRRGDDARRVTETESGGVWSIAKETRYMGGQEMYFAYSGGSVQVERETFFVPDSGKRMCILETTTVDSGTPVSSPAPKVRYQLDDHLGSACVELDASANLISYEEYYPYGTTSYQAKNTYLDGYPKRYRYSGKERDEESGLIYYGARYLAPWLCRWTSPDPGGTIDGLNLWNFVNGDPIGSVDVGGMQEGPSASEGGDPPPTDVQEFIQYARDRFDLDSHVSRDLDITIEVLGTQNSAEDAFLAGDLEGFDTVAAARSIANEVDVNRPATWWQRGGDDIVLGGAALLLSLAAVASGPPGWVALSAAFGIASGAASIGLGIAKISSSEGMTRDDVNAEFAAADTALLASSGPLALMGATAGSAVGGSDGTQIGARLC